MSEAVDEPSEQEPEEPADAGLRAALAAVVGALRETVRHESAVVAEKLRRGAFLGGAAEPGGGGGGLGGPRGAREAAPNPGVRTPAPAPTARPPGGGGAA